MTTTFPSENQPPLPSNQGDEKWPARNTRINTAKVAVVRNPLFRATAVSPRYLVSSYKITIKIFRLFLQDRSQKNVVFRYTFNLARKPTTPDVWKAQRFDPSIHGSYYTQSWRPGKGQAGSRRAPKTRAGARSGLHVAFLSRKRYIEIGGRSPPLLSETEGCLTPGRNVTPPGVASFSAGGCLPQPNRLERCGADPKEKARSAGLWAKVFCLNWVTFHMPSFQTK